MSKKDGGPAYPVTRNRVMCENCAREFGAGGVPLRDWFAGQADVPWGAVLDTMKTAGYPEPTIGEVAAYRAEVKYAEADAMLEERKKGTK